MILSAILLVLGAFLLVSTDVSVIQHSSRGGCQAQYYIGSSPSLVHACRRSGSMQCWRVSGPFSSSASHIFVTRIGTLLPLVRASVKQACVWLLSKCEAASRFLTPSCRFLPLSSQIIRTAHLDSLCLIARPTVSPVIHASQANVQTSCEYA